MELFWGHRDRGGNRERLLRELDYLKALGINNLRVLVGADGKDGIPTKAEPALQVEAGVYNDTILTGSISSCRSWINGICMPYFS